MASVYYLFDDALHVADCIVEKYSVSAALSGDLVEKYMMHLEPKLSAREEKLKDVNTCKEDESTALICFDMQSVLTCPQTQIFKAYLLQKEICCEQFNSKYKRKDIVHYGINYLVEEKVRLEIDIKKIMEEKRREVDKPEMVLHSSFDIGIDSETKDTQVKRNTVDEESQFGGTPLGEDLILKEEILEMMFDRHHLLSTEVHKGVLQSNGEMQEIEKVLKTLPWKQYLKKMRKMYYKYQKIEEDVEPIYQFADKKLRQQEDLAKLRDKSHDVRETYMGKCIADARKPFDLYSKPDKDTYERSILCEGRFIKREMNITRTEDKSKNISDQDFIFALKEIVKDCNIPPYYIDFWYKKCVGHHFRE